MSGHLRGYLDRLPETARIGVAVSGGGDSMALLHLCMQHWPKGQLFAATVNHGLRVEAAQEARFVARFCAQHQVSHNSLSIHPLSGDHDLQARARTARYDALANWGQAQGVDVILIGHTRDDLAEGFLIRLARGSGVDGLAGMADDWVDRGIRWMRPLLQYTRAELRHMVPDWIDDPSNDDPRFERVRMRQALPDLATLGLDVERLAGTAEQMTQARIALDWAAGELAKQAVGIDHGDVIFDMGICAGAPDELVHRLFAAALRWIGGQAYRPRYDALRRALGADHQCTLSGCLIIPQKGTLRVCREYAAVADHQVPAGQTWDHRWRFNGNDPDLITRALGKDGLKQVKGWREYGPPRQALLAMPSLWRGDELVTCPVIKPDADFSISLLKPFPYGP